MGTRVPVPLAQGAYTPLATTRPSRSLGSHGAVRNTAIHEWRRLRPRGLRLARDPALRSTELLAGVLLTWPSALAGPRCRGGRRAAWCP